MSGAEIEGFRPGQLIVVHNSGMPIPPFGPTGVIPEGRHQCTLDEVEQSLVKDAQFGASTTRQAIFADFRAAIGQLERIDAGLIENARIGGGFTSTNSDPSDLDVTFILNEEKICGLVTQHAEQYRQAVSA